MNDALPNNNQKGVRMTTHSPKHRRAVLAGVIPATMTVLLAGCFDGSSSSSSSSDPAVRTGTFVVSAVSGLDYRGNRTAASSTDEAGQFRYVPGET
ncbi:MAG: hypothetical protein QNL70_03435, partial [Pseudomonas sp.]